MDMVRFKLLWTTRVQIGHQRRCWQGESRSESFFAFRRSTFCSIIAQLTEETQPLFETTLKSRAVSEDSDVRFTCIVTGNEAIRTSHTRVTAHRRVQRGCGDGHGGGWLCAQNCAS